MHRSDAKLQYQQTKAHLSLHCKILKPKTRIRFLNANDKSIPTETKAYTKTLA